METHNDAWLPGSGDTIGDRFCLNELLEQRKHCVVFSAVDVESQTDVIVTVFDPDSTTQVLRSKLKDSLLAYRHPNVAPVLEFAHCGDCTFAVSERPVGHALDTGIPMNDARLLMLANDVSAALDQTYDQLGLCHGGLRPDQIVVVDEVRPED